MVVPKSNEGLGYIIEFKAFDRDFDGDFETAARAARKQIEDRQYETELKRRGVKRMKKIAIVFKSQEVKIVDGASNASTSFAISNVF